MIQVGILRTNSFSIVGNSLRDGSVALNPEGWAVKVSGHRGGALFASALLEDEVVRTIARFLAELKIDELFHEVEVGAYMVQVDRWVRTKKLFTPIGRVL